MTTSALTALTAPQSFARAITNDRGSVLSRQDAYNLVSAAVTEIQGSDSLERAYSIHERNLKLMRAAAELPRGDAAALAAVHGYERRGNEALQRLAAALGQVLHLTDALKTALNEAMANSLGITQPLNVTGLRSAGGAPVFQIEQSSALGILKAEVTVSTKPQAEVSDARILSAPAITDGQLASTLQATLRTDFGVRQAQVLAISSMGPSDQSQAYAVVVADPTNSNTPLAAYTLFVADGGGSPSMGSFVYTDSIARELAMQLAAKHMIRVAANGGPIAVLETTLRSLNLSPASFEAVRLEDSPVGFNPATEVQLMAPSLWGDIAVFVTINKQSGALRLEDYN